MPPVNVHDYERLAADALDPGVLGYYMGGAEASGRCATLSRPGSACTCAPACSLDVGETTTATNVFGTEVALPGLRKIVPISRRGNL